jgi:hypothetical protein
MPVDTKPDYFVGLDLGQSQDPTALAVLERKWLPDPADRSVLLAHLDVRHLKSWPLGTPYTTIVDEVGKLVQTPPLVYPVFGIDQTGVGRAVVDMFRQAQLSAVLRPILITTGHAITQCDDGSWHCPKKELASVLQVFLQTHRLKVAAVPQRELLVRELLAFRVKVTAAGNETFESWREKDHDDLVFAVGMAAWLADRSGNRLTIGLGYRPLAGRRQRPSNAERRGLFGRGQRPPPPGYYT